MWLLLHACSYVAAVFAFLFITLSLASYVLPFSDLVNLFPIDLPASPRSHPSCTWLRQYTEASFTLRRS